MSANEKANKNYYDFETDIIHYKGKELKLFSQFSQQQWMIDYVKENLIALYIGGSHAYGMATETSDIDVRGIFKDNINMILGYNKIEQLENETNDIVIYSLSKILKLIIDQNPNAMEALWIDKEELIYSTSEYDLLRSKREDMLSKLSKHKYTGYAYSQLKRIRNSNKKVNYDVEKKYILLQALNNKEITIQEIKEYYGHDFNLFK